MTLVQYDYIKLKKNAIELRKKGLSYSEILKQVPVAKSTLSLWLREVGLSKRQKQKLTKKKLDAARKGSQRKREIRINKTKKIVEQAKKDISKLSKKEFWLFGIALHWAEGSKPKEYSPSITVQFMNSDYKMTLLYIKWLIDILKVAKNDIVPQLYIHENHKKRIDEVIDLWAKETGLDRDSFRSPIYKKHNPKTIRKNTDENYIGCLRLTVKKSTDLNRKILGWAEGIYEKHSEVV